MADILIRGMEMPKDGRKHTAVLQFLEYGKCRAIVEYSKSYDDRSVKVFEAAPLPEGHGRLIDIEDVKSGKFHIEGRAEMYTAYNIGWNDALDSVCMNALSIVPVEGGTDE